MAKPNESKTGRALNSAFNWVGASFIFALFGFTILAIVLAVFDVFGSVI